MEKRNPWAWIPSLYFAEGLPYVVVMTLSVIMYKRLGVSNTDIALFTSWLYFPWVIKPIWSPFVDLIKTKRWWIYSMQLLIGGGMAGVAFVLPGDFFLRFTLAFFWLMAFSSATHDIAADGFYMLGLTEEQQAFFIGIRNTFYRVAMLTGQGLLVMLAGLLEESTGRISFAWSLVFFVLAGTFIALALWHKYILPRPASDAQRTNITPHTILVEFGNTFVSFFSKKGIIPALLKLGDDHYDIVSAYQKSMRGSDPDAALHYLGRLLEAGDLPSACRRLMVCACEDVGLAWPQIIPIVKAAVDIANAVGLPEARLPLADAVVLVATAPKSNSAHDGINAAIADIQAGRTGPIPRQLQNKHYDGADAKVKGQHYLYPHDYPNHWTAQQYLPDAIKDRQYYVPGDNKNEQAFAQYWKKIKGEL